MNNTGCQSSLGPCSGMYSRLGNPYPKFNQNTDVGYKKITEDKASDANLPDAEIAFQPQTRTSRSLSNAEVARHGPRVLSQTRRSPDADLASFVKHGPQPAPRFNSNASLSSSAFQHRRKVVSSAS